MLSHQLSQKLKLIRKNEFNHLINILNTFRTCEPKFLLNIGFHHVEYLTSIDIKNCMQV
jgi:hypothetical protein